jgi:hypothetical protein
MIPQSYTDGCIGHGVWGRVLKTGAICLFDWFTGFELGAEAANGRMRVLLLLRPAAEYSSRC